MILVPSRQGLSPCRNHQASLGALELHSAVSILEHFPCRQGFRRDFIENHFERFKDFGSMSRLDLTIGEFLGRFFKLSCAPFLILADGEMQPKDIPQPSWPEKTNVYRAYTANSKAKPTLIRAIRLPVRDPPPVQRRVHLQPA